MRISKTWRNSTILNIPMIKPKLHYYDLGSGVVAFSSTRHGGVGTDTHASFSINKYCGDDVEAIALNRKALASELGIETERLIVPHQVHGVESRLIANDFFSLSQPVRDQILDGVDAVMTNEAGVCVGVSTADCIPVLVYDRHHHAVAAIHAGWRGTLRHIALKTVREMTVNFGSVANELMAIIGPGISLKHFEIGQEVYDQFANADFDMDAIAQLYPVREKKEGEPPMKWHIDLKRCNRMDLEMAGLDSSKIMDSAICTFDSVEDYFSARRLGIDSGRIYNALILR